MPSLPSLPTSLPHAIFHINRLCKGQVLLSPLNQVQRSPSYHIFSLCLYRYAGMDAHLVLRNSRQLADQDPGLVGNLLIERLTGAHIYQVSIICMSGTEKEGILQIGFRSKASSLLILATEDLARTKSSPRRRSASELHQILLTRHDRLQVTKEEYVQHGSVPLGQRIVDDLRSAGKTPYFIPVGGSNALGTWGYLNFFDELINQSSGAAFTDIVMVRSLHVIRGGKPASRDCNPTVPAFTWLDFSLLCHPFPSVTVNEIRSVPMILKVMTSSRQLPQTVRFSYHEQPNILVCIHQFMS